MDATQNSKQDHNEKYSRYVCCALNIITPQNFDTLLENTLALIGDDKNKMDVIIDMIFKNSSSSSLYSEVYSKLCASILEKDRGKVPDEERYAIFCTLAFVAQMFKQKIVPLDKMQRFIDKLLPSETQPQQSLDFKLDCFIKLVEIVGKSLEELDKQYTDTIFDRIDKLTKAESLLGTRLYFLLLRVTELRENNWTPRLESLKPVTIDKIRREVEDEIERRNQEIIFWRKQRKAST
ncbi:uncharacterized protein [Clytia hemisphaerica]|uniref:uncharacterized protein isoform X4 n=1 Tax=Clytia hemisphaerica TaxID=252671 RepID=UPI0034D719BC